MAAPIIPFSAIPIRTDRTLRAVPYVTYALCLTNTFIYLTNLRLSESQLYWFDHRWAFVIHHPSMLTLFTYSFLHAGIDHLLGNMLVLWLVGTVLEAGIGSAAFAALYFGSLIAATLLHGIIGLLFLPSTLDVPLLGASGAIAGVTGFAVFRYFRMRVHTMFLIGLPHILPIPFPIPIIFWFPFWGYAVIFAAGELVAGILEITTGGGDGIAHWAHIGGLFLGVLAAMVTKVAREGRREYTLEDTVRASVGQTPKQLPLNHLAKLAREHPDDPEVYEAIAGIALTSDKLDRSRSLYLRAITLFLKTDRIERAAICYLNVLKISPDTVLRARDQIIVASALETAGHHAESLQAFVLAAEQYADFPEAQTALLRAAQICLRDLNDPEQARTLLNNLLERYPYSPWHNLALERLREIGRVMLAAQHEE